MARKVFSCKDFAKGDFILPRLHLETLCEALAKSGCKIWERPNNSDVILCWYDVFQGEMTCPFEINPVNLFHIRKSEDAKQALEEYESSLVVVITEDDLFPCELDKYRSRVLHVSSPDGFEKTQVIIERTFMDYLVWENRLNYAVARGSSLEDLLTIGSSVLHNYLFAVTFDGDVIACSKSVQAPKGILSTLAECKRVPEILKACYHAQSAPNTSKSCGVETLTIESIPCMRVPLKARAATFAYLVMVAGSSEHSLGSLVSFLNFSRYVESSLNRWMFDIISCKAPHFFSLESLITGETISQSSFESIMLDLGVGETSTFKLVLVRLSDCALCGIEKAVDALQHLHNQHCIVIPYKDFLVGLCYSELGPAVLSHERSEADLDKLLFKPFQIVCSLSQLYSDIRDTHYAFKQAEFVMERRASIENEMHVIGRRSCKPAYCFEMVFSYWLMSSESCDSKAVDFAFSFSLPEAILQADLREGTSDFAVLWYFLEGERNASYVSKRMYMHRNTVSYRIKQLEKRFDFSLDHHFYREKLVLEYRRYFNTLGPEMIKRLFEAHPEEEQH